MADSAHAPAYPTFLGRLHMRFAGASHTHEDPTTDFEARRIATDERLVTLEKNRNFIRSKYKGHRGSSYDPGRDGPIDHDLAKIHGQNLAGHTSGIPIFGNEDAAPRAGWSVGHTLARNNLTAALQTPLLPADRKGVSAENSHALGHADYGLDNELSAPAASKAQNTEQLAIELGMRHAAQQLNAQHGVSGDQSLVHAKITDVLHPETGQLLARRFKLIRRADADDKNGTTVFDHIMDGTRTHISKEEAFDLGGRVHASLMSGTAASKSTATYSPFNYHSDRHGIKGTAPPSLGDLASTQHGVLDALQRERHALKQQHGFYTPVTDRANVNMSQPAHTEVTFPDDHKLQRHGGQLQGQAALEELRQRMAAHMGADVNSFRSSGSLPQAEGSRLMMHMARFKNAHGAVLGEAGGMDPSTYSPQQLVDNVRSKIGGGDERATYHGLALRSAHDAIQTQIDAVRRGGENPDDYLDDEDRQLLRVGGEYSRHLSATTGVGKRTPHPVRFFGDD